jgi:hypothetical protein
VVCAWRTLDIFVPSDLKSHEVPQYVRDQINVVAYDSGDLVGRIRIGDGIDQGTGWHQWSVSYLRAYWINVAVSR